MESEGRANRAKLGNPGGSVWLGSDNESGLSVKVNRIQEALHRALQILQCR